MELSLRDVNESDLAIFFEQQRDTIAVEMAAFPSRKQEAFYTHWHKILADPTNMTKTIVYDGQVAGNIASFTIEGERAVGYWLGRKFWGQGIATAALAILLRDETTRPLFGHVAKHNIGSLRVLEKNGFAIYGEGEGMKGANGEEIEEWMLKLD